MFENRFDEAVEEVSTCYDLNWNDDSKVRLFARFLQEEAPHLFQSWESFLEREADDENSDLGLDEEAVIN